MKIAIIDADLIGRKNHRFPNLVCMKLSGYWKKKNADVTLKRDYKNLEYFDKVYISKVFTDTSIDESVLSLSNVEYGGTGFFFDKAPNLPDEIEHSFPDYTLYEGVCDAKEHKDYSIGFLTRGCFRKCKFCVNQKFDKVLAHSPLEEFYDASRKKICLLDDNFFGCPEWKPMLQKLIDTGKPFKFKQGLDIRIMTDDKCEMLFNAKYDGDVTFAFDKLVDYDLIESKLKLIRKYTERQCIFYVLGGFDETGVYDENFWYDDVVSLFSRMRLLMSYGCLPYITRFIEYQKSPYKGMYINLARYCNQFTFIKKMTFEEFCNLDCHKERATQKYLNNFLHAHSDFDKSYLRLGWEK